MKYMYEDEESTVLEHIPGQTQTNEYFRERTSLIKCSFSNCVGKER